MDTSESFLWPFIGLTHVLQHSFACASSRVGGCTDAWIGNGKNVQNCINIVYTLYIYLQIHIWTQNHRSSHYLNNKFKASGVDSVQILSWSQIEIATCENTEMFIIFTLWAILKINSHFLFHYYQINIQIKMRHNPQHSGFL